MLQGVYNHLTRLQEVENFANPWYFQPYSNLVCNKVITTIWVVRAATSKLTGSNHKSDDDEMMKVLLCSLLKKNHFPCMILNPRAGM